MFSVPGFPLYGQPRIVEWHVSQSVAAWTHFRRRGGEPAVKKVIVRSQVSFARNGVSNLGVEAWCASGCPYCHSGLFVLAKDSN